MVLLRISQRISTSPKLYRAALELHCHEHPARSADVEFQFALSPRDREDVRWYLEDYLERADDPAPRIAERIERQMEGLGEALFSAIFHASDEARALWEAVRPRIAETRVEVRSGAAEATAIPWELLRDPGTRTWLALGALAFIRSRPSELNQSDAQAADVVVQAEAGTVRVLLVICRPHGGSDVPFRSVASHLVAALGESAAFDLVVLRPPSFEHLAWTLRRAKNNGTPYHILHFDGHGIYADPGLLVQGDSDISGPGPDAQTGSGRRGFLLFERHNADRARDKDTNDPVDGRKLGELLQETGVQVLVLNACQSAFAEAPAQPPAEKPGVDTREEVEAYGSLVQEVLGVCDAAGMVAMRYTVYVPTAARFVADLYAALARGRALGEAVGEARKRLAEIPERRVGFVDRPLQDWSVPVVWEDAPLRLWPESVSAAPSAASGAPLAPAERAPPKRRDTSLHGQDLPRTSETGFIGRGETLYALDRAFDGENRIVLLHAYAGAGKTSTAVEFARWYAATGGTDGPVMFDSFERHRPLARVLERMGELFPDLKARDGRSWDALTNRPEDRAERRRLALAQLSRTPVLWIWDNVEPIAGFPMGSPSHWSAEEQRELCDFLEEARATRARFLLTSRRDERAWLGEVVQERVQVPPMPMRERLELAAAIAERRGGWRAEVPDLRPLLHYTGGNPLTILATVGPALREGIATEQEVEAFVARLRAGEQEFADEEEKRDRSLDASLAYGFSRAFSEEERRLLSLLYLFQGFVDATTLEVMGGPESKWGIGAEGELSRSQAVALLDRAAEVGLLTSCGGGYYTVHPALPRFFRSLFERFHPGPAKERAQRAFVQAMYTIGTRLAYAYEHGDRSTLENLANEEDNLLAALSMARANGWWADVMLVMQSLYRLYEQNGRWAAWERLVEALVLDFPDPITGGPRTGLEFSWGVFNGWRIDLAMRRMMWKEAELLQRLDITWEAKRVEPLLKVAPKKWNVEQIETIRHLGVAYLKLGIILRHQNDPSCVDLFMAAIQGNDLIGATADEAIAARELGNSYKNMPAIRDLDAAEHWFRRSLDLTDPNDQLGRAWALGQLGSVAYQRFVEAKNAGQHEIEQNRHLSKAATNYHKSLEACPATAVRDIGAIYNALGNIYRERNQREKALKFFREAVHHFDRGGYHFEAGQARRSMAAFLLELGRFADAEAFGEAAAENYNHIGEGAAEEINITNKLLVDIRKGESTAGASRKDRRP
jgi:tetratricopeptide (TPR) repeat protein